MSHYRYIIIRNMIMLDQNIWYSGSSLILTKNRKTNMIREIFAKDIRLSEHDVYDMNNNKFIPVKINTAIDIISNQYYHIPKDFFEKNVPNNDLYLAGNKIMLHGKLIDLEEISGIKKNPKFKSTLYHICTKRPALIQVNGIPMMTWDYKNWMEFSDKFNIVWNNVGY